MNLNRAYTVGVHVGEFLSFRTQNCAMSVVYERVYERRSRSEEELLQNYFSMSEEIICTLHDNSLMHYTVISVILRNCNSLF